jgi:glycosyltransferase involved in cell wall biosynthesis
VPDLWWDRDGAVIPPELAPRILALAADFNGCCWWRITSPMSELYRRGYPCYVGQNKDESTTDHIPSMDAVVLPRLSWKPEDQQLGLNWRDALHEMGIAMIFEWDDDVFTERIVRRAAEVYPEENKSEAEWDEERVSRIFAIQIADGITCSTPRLATVIRQYVEVPVKVVPNLIDLHWWRYVQRTAKRGLPEPVIGWAGGRRPDRDAEPMAVAWERIAKRHPEARFVVAGWQPAIYSRIPDRQLVRSPWLPVLEYPKNYLGVDIGCCPLSEEPFNRAKSPIKSFEWAASGAAVVASPTVYGQVIDHGKTGYLASTSDDWEWAIERLLSDRKRRRKMARRLLEVVERDWSLDRHVHKWVDAWTDIVTETRQRLGQMPSPLILPPSVPVAAGMDDWRISA